MNARRDPHAEAADRSARLGRRSITTAELREFSRWRDNAANDAAYSALEAAAERIRGRFVAQPDANGFCVSDTWTAEPVVFAGATMVGVGERDACDVADLLNRRHRSRLD
jgi:hypothetical protein